MDIEMLDKMEREVMDNFNSGEVGDGFELMDVVSQVVADRSKDIVEYNMYYSILLKKISLGQTRKRMNRIKARKKLVKELLKIKAARRKN